LVAGGGRARAARGEAPGARDDRAAAAALLDEMAGRIADPALRAAFEADAVVAAVKTG
jgi:hypothetical protein